MRSHLPTMAIPTVDISKIGLNVNSPDTEDYKGISQEMY